VREAAVIGVTHASLGEDIAAAISIVDGSQVTAEELKQFVKQRVAAYKYPRVVTIVDDLPKGPTGKVLKREIDLACGYLARGLEQLADLRRRRPVEGGHGLREVLDLAVEELAVELAELTVR
jgi:AMP-binding enzyme C-terminal domain